MIKKITSLFMLLSIFAFAQAEGTNGAVVKKSLVNVITNSDFESGEIEPWGGWGNNSTREISAEGEGYNSNYSMVMENPSDGNSWAAQTAYTFTEPLEVGKVYKYSTMVKASVENDDFTLQVQNSTTYSGEGYVSITTIPDEWILLEGEFTCELEGMDRLCINFAKVAGTYFIDDFQFGEVVETEVVEEDFVIDDFESYNLGDALLYVNTWGGENEDGGSVVVAENPTDATDKVAYVSIVNGGYNGVLGLDVTLPEGKVLADYGVLSFDLYRNSGDANYKQMSIFADDQKIHQDEDYIEQAPDETWTEKTYEIDKEIEVGNSFQLRVGIKTNNGDYYINNVVLKGRDGINKTVIVKANNDLYAIRGVVYSNVVTDFKVYAINGTLVLSKDNATTIDLSSLAKGVYIVKTKYGVIKTIK